MVSWLIYIFGVSSYIKRKLSSRQEHSLYFNYNFLQLFHSKCSAHQGHPIVQGFCEHFKYIGMPSVILNHWLSPNMDRHRNLSITLFTIKFGKTTIQVDLQVNKRTCVLFKSITWHRLCKRACGHWSDRKLPKDTKCVLPFVFSNQQSTGHMVKVQWAPDGQQLWTGRRQGIRENSVQVATSCKEANFLF